MPARTPCCRLILASLLFGTLLLLPASVGAEAANDAGSDLKFHKFQPKVPPEQAASAADSKPSAMAGIGVGAANAIEALEQEKESRTPAQRKIDSNALYTIRMLAGKPAAPGVPYLYTGVDLDENNNIVVDIVTTVSDQLLGRLRAAGAQILSSNASFRSIRAIIPPNQIENIAASPDVIFIWPKQGFATSRSALLPLNDSLPTLHVAADFSARAARVRQQLATLLPPVINGNPGQGLVTTEGDATHRAFDARGAFGIDGAGVKIGVISDGAVSLALSQATGDLPPNCGLGISPCVTVLPGQVGFGDEGTAMMEIIHDMAPGANLDFATAENGIAGFAQNIVNLRAAGCDIIVDDVGYFVESPFQDGQTGSVISTTNGGIVTQAVNDVVAAGALYFSSAGNEGNVDLGTAGTFEGDFNGIPAAAPLPAGSVQSFNGLPYDPLTSLGSLFTLYWTDPLGGSANDYDLYLLNSTGATVLGSSTNIQSGTQDPFEQINVFAASGSRLVVFQKTGASNRFFHVNNYRGQLAAVTPGETHGHNAASGAYTVAATPAARPFSFTGLSGPFPNPFNSSNLVETFTSDGPRHIFFHGDSSPITPGDVSSTGGAILNKPDITGADGVSVTGVGGFGSPFYGTSAAAPSAAAVAALVKSAKPSLTQSQIRSVLTSTAVDIMGSGFDRDSGSGIVMAFEAVNSLGVPQFANPELGTITALENPGNGNGVIEPGEGGKLLIQLKNLSGVLPATGISATLTTSTPGITITQPNTTTYFDLPAGTGMGYNLSPLTFTVGSDGCPQLINFTLTVNYTGGPPRALNFVVPLSTVTLTNNLGTTPPTAPGFTTATGMQTNRVTRNGVPSTCGSPKTFPGTITTTPKAFDSYTFTACKATCLSASPIFASGILFEVAYSPSFDPTNIATNYIGDSGSSISGLACGFTTTPGTSYTLVISDVTGTSVGSKYTLQIPACALNCTANKVPVAVAHNVTVVTSTVGGTANASIDNGSSDPDGDPLTITQSPPGPYPVGVTNVLLTVVDPLGATAQASATVTVITPTVTTISSSSPTAPQGRSVTFTANVNPPTSTGTVTFNDGTTLLGTGTLSGGVAFLTTNALALGSHSISAVYNGDSFSQSSMSPALAELIFDPHTTTSLTALPASPQPFGTAIAFTATVNVTSPLPPAGTVFFKDGSTTIGTATVSGGAATFTTNALAIGSHSITAVYGGDSDFLTSTSSVVAQTVSGSATLTADIGVTMTHTPNRPAIAFGGPVTATITVTNNDSTNAAQVALNFNSLDGPIELDSISPPDGDSCNIGGAAAQCSIASLAPGANAVFTVSFRPLLAGARTLTTAITVASNTIDSNQANNTASETLTVKFKPFRQ